MSWEITRGTGPLVVAAIHAGHDLRRDVLADIALDDAARLREEDPYTERFTTMSSNRIVVHTSRFEVDLNRPLQRAVYLDPKDAWGLSVWRKRPSSAILDASRAKWLEFYVEVGTVLDQLIARYGHVVVLDVHSYCHRRGGPQAPFDDPWANPEINIGTAGLDRATWSPLLTRMMDDLRRAGGRGQALDVRENVKFTGGHFTRWINARYGASACAIAVEFKKTFMDEWTGELYPGVLSVLEGALRASAQGVRRQLEAMGVNDDAWEMPVDPITHSESSEDHVEH